MLVKADKRFRLETILCPLCASPYFKILGRKKGDYYGQRSWHETAQIVRCRNCSLIYASPMPFPERDDLIDLYNEGYTEMLSNFIPYKERGMDFVDIFEGHRRLERIEAMLRKKGTLLDIGCGPGNLLCVARDRGWHAIGLEINEDSARFAREINGVEVITGRIQDCMERWAGYFDAVHFNQVLEHTYDPIGFLKAIRSIIRPNGAFFCGVPNEDNVMNNIAQLYFKLQMSEFTPMLSPTTPPYHVLGFSPKTIHLVFEKTVFKVLHIEHVNYRSIDIRAFKSGHILKGLESIIGRISRFLGYGYGLDVYGIPV